MRFPLSRTLRIMTKVIGIVALLSVICSAARTDPTAVGRLIDIGGRKLVFHHMAGVLLIDAKQIRDAAPQHPRSVEHLWRITSTNGNPTAATARQRYLFHAPWQDTTVVNSRLYSQLRGIKVPLSSVPSLSV
jgi:hypothetical protein